MLIYIVISNIYTIFIGRIGFMPKQSLKIRKLASQSLNLDNAISKSINLEICTLILLVYNFN
jgi:hypothetical protein